MSGSPIQPGMTADNVCGFLAVMDAYGIRVWLDGGWAVDACLGSQTRPHGDVDIVSEKRDVTVALAALQGRGYTPVARPDTRAWNFVLGGDAGHQIDFHVICARADSSAGRARPFPALDGTLFDQRL